MEIKTIELVITARSHRDHTVKGDFGFARVGSVQERDQSSGIGAIIFARE